MAECVGDAMGTSKVFHSPLHALDKQTAAGQ